MAAELFHLGEKELDDLLDIARPDLERRGIALVDGSAREAQVWAFSFSTERDLGEDHHRIATTLTMRDDLPPMLQMFATSNRVTLRDERQVAWSDLRRRGMAAVIEEALANSQYKLQVKVGVDFAHEEFIRRCDVLLDLIGDDLPNAAALREQVGSWKLLATQRALYSPLRRKLLNDLDWGHLTDDAISLEEFYENNIYKPLSARPPENAGLRGAPPPAPPPADEADRALPRRVALLDRIPKAPPGEPEATPSMLVVGIILVVVALGLLAFAVVRHSWPLIAGSGVFLLLVVRALRQWHA